MLSESKIKSDDRVIWSTCVVKFASLRKRPFAKTYIYYSRVHCQVHIVFTESILSRATTMGTEISHRVWSTHGRVLVSHFVPHHQRGSCH